MVSQLPGVPNEDQGGEVHDVSSPWTLKTLTVALLA
jgi:hypothetical protein